MNIGVVNHHNFTLRCQSVELASRNGGAGVLASTDAACYAPHNTDACLKIQSNNSMFMLIPCNLASIQLLHHNFNQPLT